MRGPNPTPGVLYQMQILPEHTWTRCVETLLNGKFPGPGLGNYGIVRTYLNFWFFIISLLKSRNVPNCFPNFCLGSTFNRCQKAQMQQCIIDALFFIDALWAKISIGQNGFKQHIDLFHALQSGIVYEPLTTSQQFYFPHSENRSIITASNNSGNLTLEIHSVSIKRP